MVVAAIVMVSLGVVGIGIFIVVVVVVGVGIFNTSGLTVDQNGVKLPASHSARALIHGCDLSGLAPS
jgi:hypothetical protein